MRHGNAAKEEAAARMRRRVQRQRTTVHKEEGRCYFPKRGKCGDDRARQGIPTWPSLKQEKAFSPQDVSPSRALSAAAAVLQVLSDVV